MDLNAPRLGFTGGPGEYFTLPAGTPRHPEVPIAEGEESILLEDKTDRLRWSLFESPMTAQVVELNDMGEPEWRPLFGEPNHALAGEPITYPPRSRMLVVLEIVYSWEQWQDACEEDPAPLLIQNPSGQPITFAQFINELHTYATRLRDLIYEIEDRNVSETARLYYTGSSGPIRKNAGDEDAIFRVHTVSDRANTDQWLEEIWTWKAEQFTRKAQPID